METCTHRYYGPDQNPETERPRTCGMPAAERFCDLHLQRHVTYGDYGVDENGREITGQPYQSTEAVEMPEPVSLARRAAL